MEIRRGDTVRMWQTTASVSYVEDRVEEGVPRNIHIIFRSGYTKIIREDELAL